MPFPFFRSPRKPSLWKHWKNNAIHQMNRKESSAYRSRALELLPRAPPWAQPSPCSGPVCPQVPVHWVSLTILRCPCTGRWSRRSPQDPLSPCAAGDACTAAGKGADTWVQKTPRCAVARIRPLLKQGYFGSCHNVILEKSTVSFLKL